MTIGTIQLQATRTKLVVLSVAIVVLGSLVGFGVARGYGGGSDQTIVLNVPNTWTIVSPSTKLSAFDYTSDDISSILTYNASTKLFEVPSESDLLDPLNAFYVKPNKGTSIQLTYDTFAPGLVSKDLSSGWNLVGTNSSDGTAIDEFSTIQSAVSTLYVPGTLNGRKDTTGTSWGSAANRDLDKSSWSTNVLNAYDGYWVYLTSPATWEKILN